MKKIFYSQDQIVEKLFKANSNVITDIGAYFSALSHTDFFNHNGFKNGMYGNRALFLATALVNRFPELSLVDSSMEKARFLLKQTNSKIALAISKNDIAKSTSPIVIKSNTTSEKLDKQEFDYILVIELQNDNNPSRFGLMPFDKVEFLSYYEPQLKNIIMKAFHLRTHSIVFDEATRIPDEVLIARGKELDKRFSSAFEQLGMDITNPNLLNKESNGLT